MNDRKLSRTYINQINDLMEQNNYELAKKMIQEIIPLIEKDNFFPILAKLTEWLSTIALELNNSEDEWLKLSLHLLSPNYSKYLSKSKYDLIFSKITQLNSIKINLDNLSSSIFTVEGGFTEYFCYTDDYYAIHLILISNLPKSIEIDTVSIEYKFSHVDLKDENIESFLISSNIHLIPHKKQKIQYRSDIPADISKIELKKLYFKVDNATISHCIDFKNYHQQVIQVSHCKDIDFQYSIPKYGLISIPFPITVHIKIGDIPKCKLGIQISPKCVQYIREISSNSTFDETLFISSETESEVECNICWNIIINGIPSLANNIPFIVPFYSPFLSSYWVLNSDNMQILEQTYLTMPNENLTTVIQIKNSLPSDIELIDISIGHKENTVAELIPLEQAVIIKNSELYSFMAFLSLPGILNDSHEAKVSFIITYRVPLYYENDINYFLDIGPFLLEPQDLSIVCDFPTSAFHYCSKDFHITITNQSELRQDVIFYLNENNYTKERFMIQGSTLLHLSILPNKSHQLDFIFYPLMIGEQQFPAMSIESQKKVIWTFTQQIHIAFAT